MSKIMQLVEDTNTSEFYPTPKELTEKMLEGIDFDKIQYVLEPSAGKGDILRTIARKTRYDSIDIDCIEKDANLREILKYNFSDSRSYELSERERELLRKEYNSELTGKETAELESVRAELKTFFKNGIQVIHDDFLTFKSFKRYDLIVMNPPFSEGDKHLLKALDVQKDGGDIVCLLNAETIRNPYTETRKALLSELNKYEHSITYVENAFASAERKADVDVAIVKVSIPRKTYDSMFYNRMKAAERVEEFEYKNTELEISDYIKAIISMYNVEVRAGLALITEYEALIPYIRCGSNKDDSPILTLNIYGSGSRLHISKNEYLEEVRYKYWHTLLCNPKFIGKLTSKMQSEYQSRVNELKKYDFTEYNIMTLVTEMNASVRKGIEEEVVAMFDRMTYEHSYYPEFLNNRHYYDGWKTNKAYKVDKKVILPCYGVFDSWDGRPRVYSAYNIINDIERVFNFLDGNMTREVNAYHELEQNFMDGNTKNINLKYFKVTFYKKGTMHIVFTNPKLVERFNIYVTKRKGWLPPSFGEKSYNSMNDEERAVAESFCGSEKAYNEIVASSAYYLAPVTRNDCLAIECGEAC